MRIPAIVPEISFLDVSTAFTSVNTGFGVPLSPVAQGDGVSNRDGAALHPVHLALKYRVTYGNASDHVRVMIVRLLYDQGLFNANQILENATGTYAALSALNYEYHGQSKADRRFEVLYDANITVSVDWHREQVREVSIPLGSSSGHPIIRYPNSGASSVPIYGGLVMVVYSVGALANAPTITVYSRLQFIDA
jgi:hypothetical protein